MSTVQKLIAVATAELGHNEKTGGDDKYIKWFGGFKLDVSWCAIFVSWCAYMAGILGDIIPKYASCDLGLKWFAQRGQFQKSRAYGGKHQPQPGDIIFFSSKHTMNDSDHTGIVVRSNKDTVYTIEGNSSNMVRNKSYTLDNPNILGYGVPNYPVEKVDEKFIIWIKSLQKKLGVKVDGIPNNVLWLKTPVLKKGMDDNDIVRLLQQRLMDLGYDLGKYGADGDFGNDTDTAVRMYQKSIGIDRPDGVLDSAGRTWKALLNFSD